MRVTRTGRAGNVDLIELTTLSEAKALISRKAITEASNVHWRRQIFESLDAMGQHLMSISSTDVAREWLNSIPRWPQLQMLDMEFRAALLVWLGGNQPALAGTPAMDLTGRSILKAATSERIGTHTAVMRVIAEIAEKAGMQHAWEVKGLFGPFPAAAAEGKTKGENRRMDLVLWDRAIRGSSISRASTGR